MDNSYGSFDQAIVRAATAHKSYENLIRSSGNNLRSGSYESAPRIKCEDVASGLSGIFSRAAAQIYEKALKLPELSFNSAAFDVRAIRAPPFPGSELGRSPSVPLFDAMELLIPSSSFHLGASECIRSLHSSISSQEEPIENGIKLEVELEGFNPTGHALSSSSFAESLMQARELFQGPSATFPATGLSSSTPVLLEPSSEGISSSLQSCPLTPSGVSDVVATKVSDSDNSPSKQDSPGPSTEDSDADPKIHSTNKRRKTQQKRVVCVPIGGESKQKGEAPPSDLWAWRKYGQKPIKGSPYPRGYYRCSSSKGCSARKQVERSRSDPTMLIVTYTSDHNHPWPANRNSSSSSSGAASAAAAAIRPISSYKGNNNIQSAQDEAAGCEISGNLFSSIINSPNAVLDEQQVVSPFESMQEEESFSLQRDVDLCLSRSNSTEEDDFFDDLGELPELSAIFRKGFLEDRLNDDSMIANSNHNNNSMDSCNIFSWASSTTLLESKVVIR